MFRKIVMPVLVGAIGIGAVAPAAASAQSFGIYVGSGYPAYDYGRPADAYYGGPVYRQPAYYQDQRERWEQHERWEREEARRRYWQHERWEHRYGWHHDEDDEDR